MYSGVRKQTVYQHVHGYFTIASHRQSAPRRVFNRNAKSWSGTGLESEISPKVFLFFLEPS